MAEEEFEEADILWPDHKTTQDHDVPSSGCRHHRRLPGKAQKRRSTPVDVQPAVVARSWGVGFSCRDDHCNDSDEEAAPPHVLTARRFSDRMAFSVCSGNGRTLKGRDLRRVRNAVLRLTGFLER